MYLALVTERCRPGLLHSYQAGAKYDPLEPGNADSIDRGGCVNLLRLGLRELTLGSRMVWDCATCYQCQEHCPEGIRVADIMVDARTGRVVGER